MGMSIHKVVGQLRLRGHHAELVVARCQENVLWLTSSSPHFDSVTLYNKCSAPTRLPLPLPSNLQIVKTRNIGSCDYTYLHHITTHWHSLAEWTVFYKGTFESRCPPHQMLRSAGNPFLCCDGNFGDFDHGSHITFLIKNYRPTNHNVSEEMRTFNGTMGKWMSYTFGKKNAHTLLEFGPNFCRGGYFMVHRDAIRKHPRSLYLAMMQQTRVLEEVDHYIERTWAALFSSETLLCAPDDEPHWDMEQYEHTRRRHSHWMSESKYEVFSTSVALAAMFCSLVILIYAAVSLRRCFASVCYLLTIDASELRRNVR
jgi:hypothetical protein